MSEAEDRDAVEALLRIMAALRDPENGCPWDRAQSYETIVPHTIEEAYEVADAIERGDREALRDELGDLLFQVVYYCQFAQEERRFGFFDVVSSLNDKLVRRHPHVFGEHNIAGIAELKSLWEDVKAAERANRAMPDPPGGASAASELDDVPRTLPALSRAAKLQRRAARVGFDFSSVDDAWGKLESETAELREALDAEDPAAAVEHEIGDVMFAAVNVARHAGVDAETAMRSVNRRFETRFRFVERALAARGRQVADTDAAELEALWEAAKRAEKEAGPDRGPAKTNGRS